MLGVPLSERGDERIAGAAARCVRALAPSWADAFADDDALALHVRSTLDELEVLAVEDGRAEKDGLVVDHDPATGATTWSVVVARRDGTPTPVCGAVEDDDIHAPCLHPCDRPAGHRDGHASTVTWDDGDGADG